ncbi:MAG TPA: Ig-like domain-containing protein, partial [Actinomycetota bacterium]|nr:Ig-like domain-containing protein [Actinomycetota bacterium]
MRRSVMAGLGDRWAFGEPYRRLRTRVRKPFTIFLLLAVVVGLLGPAAFAEDPADPGTAIGTTAEPTTEPTQEPTPAPTETPTAEPSPSESPSAEPSPAPSPPESPSPEPSPTLVDWGHPPTIASDKPDYAPGDTVILTGEYWQPGEVVHIRVNDDQSQSWRRDVDVTATEEGKIRDEFQLPTWFVATYTVTATGPLSGTANTTFTDASLRVHRGPTGNPPNITFTVTYQTFSNDTCTNNPGTVQTAVVNSDAGTNLGGLGGGPNAAFVKLTAPATPSSPPGYTFDNWSSTSGSDNSIATTTSRSICVRNPTGAQNDAYRATYKVANAAPVANNDSYSTNEDTTLNVSAPGVLGNDTDADGNPLTAILVSSTSNGSLTLNANGSFTYNPDANFNGSDSFTYRANDGTANSNAATVTITVNAVNDEPTANGQSLTFGEDSSNDPITLTGSPGPANENTQTLTFVLDSLPANGSLSESSGGSVITTAPHVLADPEIFFTPDPNYCTTGNAFTFHVMDDGGTANGGDDTSPPATVNITVTCVNDPPTVSAISGPGTVDESTTADRTYTFTISDPDDSSFSFVSGYPSCGANGTLQRSSITGSSGTFDCRFPDGDATSTLAVKVTDGEDASNESTNEVTIENVDPTVTLSGPTTADEGQTETYTFTTSDPGDEVFSFATGSPSCGTGGVLVGTPTIDPST